jgi:hypothetical protein
MLLALLVKYIVTIFCIAQGDSFFSYSVLSETFVLIFSEVHLQPPLPSICPYKVGDLIEALDSQMGSQW